MKGARYSIGYATERILRRAFRKSTDAERIAVVRLAAGSGTADDVRAARCMATRLRARERETVEYVLDLTLGEPLQPARARR